LYHKNINTIWWKNVRSMSTNCGSTTCDYCGGSYTSGAREYHYYTATTTRDDCYKTTINYYLLLSPLPSRRALRLVQHKQIVTIVPRLRAGEKKWIYFQSITLFVCFYLYYYFFFRCHKICIILGRYYRFCIPFDAMLAQQSRCYILLLFILYTINRNSIFLFFLFSRRRAQHT